MTGTTQATVAYLAFFSRLIPRTPDLTEGSGCYREAGFSRGRGGARRVSHREDLVLEGRTYSGRCPPPSAPGRACGRFLPRRPLSLPLSLSQSRARPWPAFRGEQSLGTFLRTRTKTAARRCKHMMWPCTCRMGRQRRPAGALGAIRNGLWGVPRS